MLGIVLNSELTLTLVSFFLEEVMTPSHASHRIKNWASEAWWLRPGIPAFLKLRQEDQENWRSFLPTQGVQSQPG